MNKRDMDEAVELKQGGRSGNPWYPINNFLLDLVRYGYEPCLGLPFCI
jgi:hypothetical protein